MPTKIILVDDDFLIRRELRFILEEEPEVLVVGEAEIAAMQEAGASGYVVKSMASKELIKAVRVVMSGMNYFDSPELTSQ